MKGGATGSVGFSALTTLEGTPASVHWESARSTEVVTLLGCAAQVVTVAHLSLAATDAITLVEGAAADAAVAAQALVTADTVAVNERASAGAGVADLVGVATSAIALGVRALALKGRVARLEGKVALTTRIENSAARIGGRAAGGAQVGALLGRATRVGGVTNLAFVTASATTRRERATARDTVDACQAFVAANAVALDEGALTDAAVADLTGIAAALTAGFEGAVAGVGVGVAGLEGATHTALQKAAAGIARRAAPSADVGAEDGSAAPVFVASLPIGTAGAITLGDALAPSVPTGLVGRAAGAFALLERTLASVLDTAHAVGTAQAVALGEGAGADIALAGLARVAADAVALDVVALARVGLVAALVRPARTTLEDVAARVEGAAARCRDVTARLIGAAGALKAALAVGAAGAFTARELAITAEGLIARAVGAAVATGKGGSTGVNRSAATRAYLIAGLRRATDVSSSTHLAITTAGVATLDGAFAASASAGLPGSATHFVAFDGVALAGEPVAAGARRVRALIAVDGVAAGVAGEAALGAEVLASLWRTAGAVIAADLSVGATTIGTRRVGARTLEVRATGAIATARAGEGATAAIGWVAASGAGGLTGQVGVAAGRRLTAQLDIVAARLTGLTTGRVTLYVHTLALEGVGVATARRAAVPAVEGLTANVDGVAAGGWDVAALLRGAAGILVTDIAFTAAVAVALFEGALAETLDAGFAGVGAGALAAAAAGVRGAADRIVPAFGLTDRWHATRALAGIPIGAAVLSTGEEAAHAGTDQAMIQAVGATGSVAETAATVVVTTGRAVAARRTLAAGGTADPTFVTACLAASCEQTLAGSADTLFVLRRAQPVARVPTGVVLATGFIRAVGSAVEHTRIVAVVAVLIGAAAVVTASGRTSALPGVTDLELGATPVGTGIEGADTLVVFAAGAVGATVATRQLVAAAIGRCAALEGVAGQRRTATRI